MGTGALGKAVKGFFGNQEEEAKDKEIKDDKKQTMRIPKFLA